MCNMCKDFFKETFFEMNKFSKKQPINLCKFYDSGYGVEIVNVL